MTTKLDAMLDEYRQLGQDMRGIEQVLARMRDRQEVLVREIGALVQAQMDAERAGTEKS